MNTTTEDTARHKRQYLQLHRLERLADVIYAIVIWRVFSLIPKPGTAEWTWGSMTEFLTANILIFALAIIAVVVTTIYWLQNNILFGNLETTDGRHTMLSILQLFLVMVFLYSMRLGIVLGGSAGTRAFESVAAALVGIAGWWTWSYAVKNRRLLLPEVSDAYALQLKDRTMAEPLTALITLPFAFVGPVFWELSWLSYPLVAFLFKRRRQARST